MKARRKIILDRIIAKPLAFLLNLIVWPLGQIFRIEHDDSPDKVKVVAIAKLLGIGSIIRATPMVRALKHKYHSARFILITISKNKPLVERLELFDTYLYLRDNSFFTLFFDISCLLVKLWRYNIDLYFDLEVYSAFSTILATFSLARNRFGFYKGTTLYRRGLLTHQVYFNESRHISEIYLQLAKACGIKSINYKIERIKILDIDKQELKNWLFSNKLSFDNPYIVINPNASDLLLERRWPMSYFVALIDGLTANWNNPIIIVGNQQEYSYVHRLWSSLSGRAKEITFNSAGKISLGAVAVLINNTKLMITNDSGLYHISVDLGVSVISLWGPVSPIHYAGPATDKNNIFYCKEIYCSPCLHKTNFPPCGGNNICMKSISPREVYSKSCELLGIHGNIDVAYMDLICNKMCRQDIDITIRTPMARHKYQKLCE